MKKPIEYGLLVTVCNVLGFFLWMRVGAYFFFQVIIGVLLTELVLGIVFMVGESKKNLGAGLLLGAGITLLIGLSVCGIMLANWH